jgi:hypothetical protein
LIVEGKTRCSAIPLEEVLPLEPIFKTVKNEAKVIRNAALQAYGPGTAYDAAP